MSNSVALHDPAFLLEGCFGAMLFKGEDGDTLSPESLIVCYFETAGGEEDLYTVLMRKCF